MDRENTALRKFGDFADRVLQQHMERIETAEERVCRHSMGTMRYVGVVVALIDMFWMVTDFIRSDSLNLLQGISLPLLLLLTVFSFVMVGLSERRTDRLSGKTIQRLLLAYDCLVIAVVLVLRVTKNVTIVENGAVSRFTGVPLSSYYLLLVAILPLPSLTLGAVLLAGSIAALFLPLVLPGAEAYNLLQNLILEIVSVVLYLMFRVDNLNLGHARLREEELNRQLLYSSYADGLTGALNRRACDEYLEHLRGDRSVRNVGVFMFDIDNFKSYNDTYSHLKGDAALKSVSGAVIDAFPEDGVFVFRYGGEEFLVISEDPDRESAERSAERILDAVRRRALPRSDIPGFPIVTVTVGWAVEPNDRPERQDMILRADNALYEGKRGVKNCAFGAD